MRKFGKFNKLLKLFIFSSLLIISSIYLYEYPYKKYIVKEKFEIFMKENDISYSNINSIEVTKAHMATPPIVIVVYNDEPEYTYLYSYFGNYDSIKNYRLSNLDENYTPHHCLVSKNGIYLTEDSYYYKHLKYLPQKEDT